MIAYLVEDPSGTPIYVTLSLSEALPYLERSGRTLKAVSLSEVPLTPAEAKAVAKAQGLQQGPRYMVAVQQRDSSGDLMPRMYMVDPYRVLSKRQPYHAPTWSPLPAHAHTWASEAAARKYADKGSDRSVVEVGREDSPTPLRSTTPHDAPPCPIYPHRRYP